MRRAALIALIFSSLTPISLLAQGSAKAAVPVPHVAGLPAAAEQAMATVDPEKIRAHVKFLASDLLEGRGTGARGGDIAAEYIATQFALYGLEPAGDHGSYLQKVAMLGIATQDDTTFALVPDKGDPMNLRNRMDFVAMDETTKTVNDIDAPIVWIGYGIDAPEFNWNDYKDVDVKGKVLLMMVNQPPSDDPKFFAGGKALTYYGRWTYKYEQAARMGAAGVILIHKTDMASYGWNVVRNSWSGERAYLRDDPAPKLKVASWIQLDVAAQTCRGLRHESRRDDGRGAEAGLQGGHVAGQAEGPHRQHGAAVRVEQCNCQARRFRSQAERRRRHLQRALRSPGHRAGHAGRQHLQRRAGQRAQASAFCWRSRAPSRRRRSRRSVLFTLPRSPRKSRDCAAPSIWACIRRSPRKRFRST